MLLHLLTALAAVAAQPHYDSAAETFFAKNAKQVESEFHRETGVVPETYAMVDLDGDGNEELWVLGDSGSSSMVFCSGGGEIASVLVCDFRQRISLYDNYVFVAGGAGTGAYFTSTTVLEDSRVKMQMGDLELTDMEGNTTHECSVGEKDVTYEEYLSLMPKGRADAYPLVSSRFRPWERLTGARVDIADISGWYEYDLHDETGENAPCGRVTVVTRPDGTCWFKAESVTATGNLANLSSEKWIPFSGNKVNYRYDLGRGDYYEMWMEFYPTMLIITEDFSHGAFTLFGMGACLGGTYYRHDEYFSDGSGNLYRAADADKPEATLTPGGFYSGTVTIPTSVKHDGRNYKVTGVDAGTFAYNTDVTALSYDPAETRLGPGSLIGADNVTAGLKVNDPVFVYPASDRKRFVHPCYPDEESHSPADGRWIVFKHFVEPAVNGGFVDPGKEICGRFEGNFDSNTGVRATLVDGSVVKTMFKGYQSYDIEALLASDEYVATHEFPAFSRWKYPEREQPMPQWFATEMQVQKGRPVQRTRRIGKLREGDGELAIAEFEINEQGGMIVIAWIEDKKVVASWTATAELIDGSADSLWGVDDGGEYGIPSLISIARDGKGGIDLFLVHQTPEGVHTFLLRSQGEELVEVFEDAWYRYF